MPNPKQRAAHAHFLSSFSKITKARNEKNVGMISIWPNNDGIAISTGEEANNKQMFCRDLIVLKGKKRMKQLGKIMLPQEAFMAVVR